MNFHHLCLSYDFIHLLDNFVRLKLTSSRVEFVVRVFILFKTSVIVCYWVYLIWKCSREGAGCGVVDNKQKHPVFVSL